MRNGFVTGRLSHERFIPTYRDFRFNHCMVLINLSDLKKKSLPWFLSSDKVGVFSINCKNYINGLDIPISDKLDKQYSVSTTVGKDITWWILTTPRFLFYSFNPASFYFGIDQSGILKIAAVEVHNTFSESHVYTLNSKGEGHKHSIRDSHSKEFHVSPFINDYGHYDFYLSLNEQNVSIQIILDQDQNKVMDVMFNAGLLPLNNSNFTKNFLGLLKTVILTEFRILKQAYILYFRNKYKVITKPPLSKNSCKSPSRGFISRLKFPF